MPWCMQWKLRKWQCHDACSGNYASGNAMMHAVGIMQVSMPWCMQWELRKWHCHEEEWNGNGIYCINNNICINKKKLDQCELPNFCMQIELWLHLLEYVEALVTHVIPVTINISYIYVYIQYYRLRNTRIES